MDAQSRELLFQDRHPLSQRHAVFEDDGTSAWLYLTRPAALQPVADCWVYNRIPAPPASEIGQYSGGPPPACREVAIDPAPYGGQYPPQVEFLWSTDGESVAVCVNGVATAFIAGSQDGYCRNLLRTGPWGSPWDYRLFAGLFPSNDPKRYYRFDDEAPFAVQWMEWTGEWNTRQVTRVGERWICSLDRYVEDFGPTLAHQPLSESEPDSLVAIAPEEFEGVWDTAVRYREAQSRVNAREPDRTRLPGSGVPAPAEERDGAAFPTWAFARWRS